MLDTMNTMSVKLIILLLEEFSLLLKAHETHDARGFSKRQRVNLGNVLRCSAKLMIAALIIEV